MDVYLETGGWVVICKWTLRSRVCGQPSVCLSLSCGHLSAGHFSLRLFTVATKCTQGINTRVDVSIKGPVASNDR